MTNLISEILGTYTPQDGYGIAALDPVWVVGAIIFIMLVWFILRMIINLFGGGRRG